MKRIISFLLLISFLAIVFFAAVSCGNAKSDGETEKNSNQMDDSGNNGENPRQGAQNARISPPDLPAANLGGADFVIMTSEAWGIPVWAQNDIYAEQENGETINDAVYRRNSIIEERYNCRIRELQALIDSMPAQIKTLVAAGDSSVDAATIRLMHLKSLAPGNNLVEFKRLAYIDVSNPWWDQNCVKDLSIAGKIFGVASDMTVMDNKSTCAVVFNKKMQADFSIENLYSLVEGGKWTIDKLLELLKLVSIDLDGNGIMDHNDAYGLIYQRDTLASFLSGCGEFVAGKDENDLPVLTLNTPKAIEVLDKLFDILYDEIYCLHTKRFDNLGKDGYAMMNEMFQDDRALFLWIRMADVENLRTMETDFGILPIPKYNEQQKKHMQTVNPWTGVVTTVPQSAANIENSSVILEAMAYESKYILQPAYYDVMLNAKLARDEESNRMLDIIFGNRTYDIGDVFDFNSLGSDLIFMTMTYDRNIASMYEKKEAKAISDIEELVENIKGIN
ncbi:MAG: hypothetical protein FWG34_03755 [Oscillospiraceae bacterium]|nr:hypothetical protein [Oscillospiraceae bacterium]